ncbi:Gfo/Idh/MocA family oxidoreductase [Humibacter antri]
MPQKLRVGIVGSGIMATGIANAIAAEPDVEITAVASRTRQGAENFAWQLDRSGGVWVADDFAQLCDSDRVDAVVITTPDHLHGDVMVAAAQGGKHFLVEKPFTTSTADADRAVHAVRVAGVVAMCLYNHRWVPAYAQAKELMDELGDPVLGYARKDDTIMVPTEMLTWADKTTCAWFLSSHDIDLVSWLFDDRVISVTALAREGLLASRGIQTPDAIQIQARYSRGAIATFESAWIYPNTFPTVVDSYVAVIGEGGTIQLDRQKESIALTTADGFRFPRNMLQRTMHGEPAGAYRDALRHFIDCCITGAQPLIDVESARDVTAVLEAAHRSIKSGHTELVEPFGLTGIDRNGADALHVQPTTR